MVFGKWLYVSIFDCFTRKERYNDWASIQTAHSNPLSGYTLTAQPLIQMVHFFDGKCFFFLLFFSFVVVFSLLLLPSACYFWTRILFIFRSSELNQRDAFKMIQHILLVGKYLNRYLFTHWYTYRHTIIGFGWEAEGSGKWWRAGYIISVLALLHARGTKHNWPEPR